MQPSDEQKRIGESLMDLSRVLTRENPGIGFVMVAAIPTGETMEEAVPQVTIVSNMPNALGLNVLRFILANSEDGLEPVKTEEV